jgi:hypothetical protein
MSNKTLDLFVLEEFSAGGRSASGGKSRSGNQKILVIRSASTNNYLSFACSKITHTSWSSTILLLFSSSFNTESYK